jgi:hypothetical protein
VAGASGVGLSYGVLTEPANTHDNPPDLPQGFVAKRLADDGTTLLRVRVLPTTSGRRRLVLCAGGEKIASLPTVPPGTRLVGASADDRMVIWRTARSATRGEVVVGRINGSRVTILRRTPTQRTGKLRARDGRITIAPNGDAAWALDEGTGRSEQARLWVWPHGRRVREIRLAPAQRNPLNLIRLIDDQHLVLEDSGPPVMFAPATPGTCPRPTAGNWTDLAGWQTRDAYGFTFGNDNTETTNLRLVCDTTSGRLIQVSQFGGAADHYCSVDTHFSRTARVGPFLVLERQSKQSGGYCGGPYYRYDTQVTDTRTSKSSGAAGGLSGPDVPPPPQPTDTPGVTTPESLAQAGVGPAVVFEKGVIAWARPIAATPGHFDVVLADGAGTAVVGKATSPFLALDDRRLRWTDESTVVSRPVSSASDWATAVVP